MNIRVDRIPAALKHGAYSATAVLPVKVGPSLRNFIGSDCRAYPSGVLEDDIVSDMARLVWRKQNLRTLRIAERAQKSWSDTLIWNSRTLAQSRFSIEGMSQSTQKKKEKK